MGNPHSNEIDLHLRFNGVGGGGGGTLGNRGIFALFSCPCCRDYWCTHDYKLGVFHSTWSQFHTLKCVFYPWLLAPLKRENRCCTWIWLIVPQSMMFPWQHRLLCAWSMMSRNQLDSRDEQKVISYRRGLRACVKVQVKIATQPMASHSVDRAGPFKTASIEFLIMRTASLSFYKAAKVGIPWQSGQINGLGSPTSVGWHG